MILSPETQHSRKAALLQPGPRYVSFARSTARMGLGPAYQQRSGFTLIELMVVITIIGILSSLMLVAMYTAQEGAKASKTRSTIAKLDAIIQPMYESYRTRAIPVETSSGSNAAVRRLSGLRDLQRMEMPDRWTDIGSITGTTLTTQGPIVPGLRQPAIHRTYARRLQAALTANTGDIQQFQHAETLYLIVSLASEDGLENFHSSVIGDVDGDGLKEFLDGWGRPIRWLRWPAGYDSSLNRVIGSGVVNSNSALEFSGDVNLADSGPDTPNPYAGHFIRFTSGPLVRQVVPIQGYDGSTQTFTLPTPNPPSVPGLTAAPGIGNRFDILAPDRFDTRRVQAGRIAFETHPLIYSQGPDEESGLETDISGSPLSYPAVGNNPFFVLNSTYHYMVGSRTDGSRASQDNITNHDMGRR